MKIETGLYKFENSGLFKNLLYCIFLFGFCSIAQSENNFTDEVKSISQKYDTIWKPEKETIIFTGSSSVRLWKALKPSFPEHQILNTGFGGSQASDLLVFLDDLVLAYNPKKVFIYEGDNDLWAKKTPNEVIKTTKTIIHRIKTKNPTTKILLISAKPSISRWEIRRKYMRLNRKMERLTKKDTLTDYVDVWYPMLNNKKLRTDIFIEDGLHMNQKGYDIWHKVMKDLITNH